MTKQQRIIEVATRIGELRSELRQLEAELARLAPSDAPKPRGASADGSADRETSLPARVLALLEAHPGQVFDADAVAKALDESNVPYIRSTLVRLLERQKIEKPETGKYKARQPGQERMLMG